MEPKEILLELRTKHGLSQEQLAEKVHVTRQAVSRWETGETVPNTETLKLLSKLFDVSINTLLGSPRQLICQCCGMPLEDTNISREPDGTFNEEYCKWCYSNGKYVYTSLEELCKAVFDAEVNPHHTHQQSEDDLDDSADIQNKDVVADWETGDQRDDPDKGQLNEQTWHRAQREPRSGGDQIRADHSQRRHPQREVQPVPPGGAGAPFSARIGFADPVIQAAVPLIGGAQFGGDQSIGDQKQEDHKDPPEELAVADGCDRRCGFRYKYNADDRQDHAAETEFFLHRLASLSLWGMI